MIVVDVNVLADFLVGDESLKIKAATLASIDPTWIAPSLWRYELGNVLWKVLQFSDHPEKEIKKAFTLAEQLIEETVEELDWEAVLSFAKENELTYYDASYVWLAQTLEIPLYTRDKKILRNCPATAKTYQSK